MQWSNVIDKKVSTDVNTITINRNDPIKHFKLDAVKNVKINNCCKESQHKNSDIKQ